MHHSLTPASCQLPAALGRAQQQYAVQQRRCSHMQQPAPHLGLAGIPVQPASHPTHGRIAAVAAAAGQPALLLAGLWLLAGLHLLHTLTLSQARAGVHNATAGFAHGLKKLWAAPAAGLRRISRCQAISSAVLPVTALPEHVVASALQAHRRRGGRAHC
jgi:hypothetical protein